MKYFIITLFLIMVNCTSFAQADNIREVHKNPLSNSGCKKLKEDANSYLKLMYIHSLLPNTVINHSKKADDFLSQASDIANIYKAFCKIL